MIMLEYVLKECLKFSETKESAIWLIYHYLFILTVLK